MEITLQNQPDESLADAVQVDTDRDVGVGGLSGWQRNVSAVTAADPALSPDNQSVVDVVYTHDEIIGVGEFEAHDEIRGVQIQAFDF